MQSLAGFARKYAIMEELDGGFGAGSTPEAFVRLDSWEGRIQASLHVKGLKQGPYTYKLYLIFSRNEKLVPLLAGSMTAGYSGMQNGFEIDANTLKNNGVKPESVRYAAITAESNENKSVPLFSSFEKSYRWDESIRQLLLKKPMDVETAQLIQAEAKPNLYPNQQVNMIPHQEGDRNLSSYDMSPAPVSNKIESETIPASANIASAVQRQIQQENYYNERSGFQGSGDPHESSDFGSGSGSYNERSKFQGSGDPHESSDFGRGSGSYNERSKFQGSGDPHESSDFGSGSGSYNERSKFQGSGDPRESSDFGSGSGSYNERSKFQGSGDPHESSDFGSGSGSYNRCDINKLEGLLQNNFESYSPFKRARGGYTWYRVSDLAKLSNIMYLSGVNVPVFANPKILVGLFKFKHILAGLYRGDNGANYYVIGVPAKDDNDNKPFENACRWVPVSESTSTVRDMGGYWLVYVSLRTGEIVV